MGEGRSLEDCTAAMARSGHCPWILLHPLVALPVDAVRAVIDGRCCQFGENPKEDADRCLGLDGEKAVGDDCRWWIKIPLIVAMLLGRSDLSIGISPEWVTGGSHVDDGAPN
ncbi:hypothetical protein ACLOJK_019316 [Asimina triloba]